MIRKIIVGRIEWAAFNDGTRRPTALG